MPLPLAIFSITLIFDAMLPLFLFRRRLITVFLSRALFFAFLAFHARRAIMLSLR